MQNCSRSGHRYTGRVKTIAIVPVLGALLLAGCDPKPTTTETTANATPSTTNATVAATPVTNAFAVLQGKWQRADGDYLIEIRSAEASGKLDAGYFNPAPINVSRAHALRESGALKVFVELRDVNYPGSTYALTYDPKHDHLFGQYYQATMGQTYDVAFVRVK